MLFARRSLMIKLKKIVKIVKIVSDEPGTNRTCLDHSVQYAPGAAVDVSVGDGEERRGGPVSCVLVHIYPDPGTF